MEEKAENILVIKDKIFSFIKKNYIKILFIVFLVTLSLAILIFFQFNQKKKNNLISEEYLKASLMISSNEFEKSREILENIIFSKNKFYSNLALNLILEKKLEKDFNRIISYFEAVEKLSLSKDQYELLIFKKALYLMKSSKIEEGKKLLKNLANSKSNIKNLAINILKE
ncbi:MAG: hypothetical protein VXW47_02435 [Pseudomonadota bacterium]|nr:hypothetical protein [Pseudomonadota bacterium]